MNDECVKDGTFQNILKDDHLAFADGIELLRDLMKIGNLIMHSEVVHEYPNIVTKHDYILPSDLAVKIKIFSESALGHLEAVAAEQIASEDEAEELADGHCPFCYDSKLQVAGEQMVCPKCRAMFVGGKAA